MQFTYRDQLAADWIFSSAIKHSDIEWKEQKCQRRADGLMVGPCGKSLSATILD